MAGEVAVVVRVVVVVAVVVEVVVVVVVVGARHESLTLVLPVSQASRPYWDIRWGD